jgi:hypothetical protein
MLFVKGSNPRHSVINLYMWFGIAVKAVDHLFASSRSPVVGVRRYECHLQRIRDPNASMLELRSRRAHHWPVATIDFQTDEEIIDATMENWPVSFPPKLPTT